LFTTVVATENVGMENARSSKYGKPIGDFHLICKLAASVWQTVVMYPYSDLQKLKKTILFKFVVLKYS